MEDETQQTQLLNTLNSERITEWRNKLTRWPYIIVTVLILLSQVREAALQSGIMGKKISVTKNNEVQLWYQEECEDYWVRCTISRRYVD